MEVLCPQSSPVFNSREPWKGFPFEPNPINDWFRRNQIRLKPAPCDLLWHLSSCSLHGKTFAKIFLSWLSSKFIGALSSLRLDRINCEQCAIILSRMSIKKMFRNVWINNINNPKNIPGTMKNIVISDGGFTWPRRSAYCGCLLQSFAEYSESKNWKAFQSSSSLSYCLLLIGMHFRWKLSSFWR